MKHIQKSSIHIRYSLIKRMMKHIVFKYQIIALLLLAATSICAQKKQPTQEALELEAKQYVAEGNDYLVNDKNFPAAEGEYRKAIAKNPIYEPAKYNLGNAYYVTEKYDEALQRFGQTSKVTDNKQIKHMAFHNQGNTFMRQQNFGEAVEAYKNALRNNPTDDETRYNLALAKKMKEQQDQQNQDNKDQNKDDKKDDKKDKKDGDKNEDQKEKEGEKDEKKKDQEGKDEKDDRKEGDDKKDGEDKEDEEGKPKEDKKEEGKDEKDGQGDQKEEQQPPQQVPGQLSPQQVKSLLEAMNNQEKKVQEKINAKKVKGAKVQTEKDW